MTSDCLDTAALKQSALKTFLTRDIISTFSFGMYAMYGQAYVGSVLTLCEPQRCTSYSKFYATETHREALSVFEDSGKVPIEVNGSKCCISEYSKASIYDTVLVSATII